MAEESHYSTDNKRKYDDSPAPPSRRPTGFSAPISSLSPTDGSSVGQQTASYNSVPPPMDEIQLAKQKAQEIAARLFSNAANAEAKKPRVENGNGGGYDANEGMYQKSYASMAPPPTSSYGYSSTSKKIDVPNGRVGVIIGKGGETIKYLQLQSGAKIQVTRDMDADPNSPNRAVELMGTPEQISKAEQLIQEVLAEATAGGAGGAPRRGEQSGSDHFVMIVPNNKVGLVIGKGGETIKNMQARTGARIQVIPLHLPPGDTSGERTVQIDGTNEQIEAAKQLVNEVISENRMRNQGGMSGGYSQQGYQARPQQTNWAPPGAPPMQQPGYGGYVQPGASYPGSAQQYNTNQPSYPGYPPQPTPSGYATGWDQSAAPPNQQQPGGYDYYGQQPAAPPPPHQQPAGAPADYSGYAYNQGQAYSQDAYGAYPQSGYGQPQTNPNAGYDQQGYNTAPSDGHTPYGTTQGGGGGEGTQVPPGQSSSATGQQSYPTGQQPSPKPGYPPQPQPGYGGYGTQPPGAYYAPQQQQVQKPPPSGQPSYGQPQQSPSSAQGGYDQSYPPVQATYAQQPESAGQQPPTGYGPPPPSGYGAPPPPYGAPPPNYGQPQAPLYGASYGGGGYAQPQAYSGDGSSGGGSARGTSDSTPQSAVQPGGPAKASPPS